MARPTVEPMHDKVLYRLTWLAAELSAIANIMKAPPMPPIPEQAHGKPIVMALLCWAGERAVARLRGLATPLADMVRPMPYPEMDQFTEGGPGPDHEAARSLYLDAVELPTAEAIVEHLRASTAPLAVSQPRVLGGAMALATADSLGMAAVAEGIRALQAAQAGEVSQVGMGTAATLEASRNVFRREGEYWTVVFDGSVVRLKDTKGLRHLARLLAHPGREFHTTDLEAAQSRPSPAAVGPGDRAGGGELAVRPDLGDAGALLDATAKAAYRARLAELRTELEEAEGFNDPARAAKARQEMEFLVGELARAVGLGGRDRRAASHAERARLNVTRAIRAAVANLARDNPALGRHLAATIRTGRYCAYLPDPRAPIAWNRWPGPSAPGLHTGAPGLNAPPAEEGPARRRRRGARSRRRWEAAAVLVRLWIEGSQPLAGTAATQASEPLRFDGWLELVRVVSELVAAAPSSDEDADAAR